MKHASVRSVTVPLLSGRRKRGHSGLSFGCDIPTVSGRLSPRCLLYITLPSQLIAIASVKLPHIHSRATVQRETEVYPSDGDVFLSKKARRRSLHSRPNFVKRLCCCPDRRPSLQSSPFPPFFALSVRGLGAGCVQPRLSLLANI